MTIGSNIQDDRAKVGARNMSTSSATPATPARNMSTANVAKVTTFFS